MGYTRQDLERYRDATVADLVGPGVKLLFVGINPGLWTAATQTHFGHPGNRFYPALFEAGIIDHQIERGSPISDDDRNDLVARGIGITNLVARATARASELGRAELIAGVDRLRTTVVDLGAPVVAVAGITAYRSAFRQPKAVTGRQVEPFAGAALWVVPNPSGLNAHETIATLAAAYAGPAREAGLLA